MVRGEFTLQTVAYEGDLAREGTREQSELQRELEREVRSKQREGHHF